MFPALKIDIMPTLSRPPGRRSPLRDRMSAAGNSGNPARVQAAADEFQQLLAEGDPEAVAIYREHQQDSLGEDPLAEGACDWPAELADPEAEAVVVDVPRSEPLLGWRMWGVRGSYLVAPFVTGAWGVSHKSPGVSWRRGVNTVSARWCAGSGSHPTPSCRCGIRAVQSRTVLDSFAHEMEDRLGEPAAIARVAVWGRVASFAPDDDWRYTLRAEHAEITGPIELAPAYLSSRAGIARRYDLDVEVWG